ncbi:MAG TPA: nodulation protein NfeD [Ignavibacteriales bacterium]|nr:nodulation protein NfeD [Ignavibacteriales bacterium]
MKRLFYLLLCIVMFSPLSYSQSGKVYVGIIEGEIDLGLIPYVKRVISEAEKNNASAVIFKVNTFGGRVDAATEIKDAILNTDVLTIAYIDKRAISAGSLISLSCKKIAMSPGSSIGATTVVDASGVKQSEKAQSYMRSEMRATAERNGRRTDIAEGMVDESIIVEGLSDSLHLITLTANEAVKYDMADTISNNLDEVLASFNLKNAELVSLDESWLESVVRFLNNPIVSSLLIMIGLVGLFTEIKTPGWGLPGTAALIALALFFGSGFLLDIASVFEILLFIAGVVLLVLEIFVIPGFGIAGISGIILIFAGIFLSLLSDFPIIDGDMIMFAIVQLALTLLASIAFIAILWKTLPKTKMFHQLVLDASETTELGYVSNPVYVSLLNMEGKALTDLRPSGTAIINDARVDVVTFGNYIEKGSAIIVKQVEGTRVVVEKKS